MPLPQLTSHGARGKPGRLWGRTGHSHDKQSQYGKELEPPTLNLESSALAGGRARLLQLLTVLLVMEESQQS